MGIVGVIPMAGDGLRLGLPFPKALAPTLTRDGIVPLYRHAYDRLHFVTDRILFVVGPKALDDPCLASLPGEVIPKRERGELPSSLRLAGEQTDGDDLLAIALPDTIWEPIDGFVRVCEAATRSRDGALGLFPGDGRELDRVTTTGDQVTCVSLHAAAGAAGFDVIGWGIVAMRAASARNLSDDAPLAEQLNRMDLRAVELTGPYRDLGTPERYAAYMDLRRASEPMNGGNTR
jgi:hypothetical protein